VSQAHALSADGRAQFHFAESADVDRFLEMLARFEGGEIGPDEWRAFRLVHGTYSQRQEGGDLSMLRVKLPQGGVTSQQLRVAADVAERYSRGFLHVTTRQNFQFHFVKLGDVEAALRAFVDCGVTSREACGNSVRNITLSPTAGVAADELFDVAPYAEALTRYLLRHPLSSSLPRKFKIAFSGGGSDHAFAAVNDIGFIAALENGVRGFRIRLAGGTATVCTAGKVFREFLPAGDILRLAEAVIRVFHRLGDRVHRHKNRMKFLVRALGWERFQSEIATELAAVPPAPLPFAPESPPAAAPYRRRLVVIDDARLDAYLEEKGAREPFPAHLPALGGSANEDDWRRWNVKPQKQAGLSMVTLHLPLGDVTAGRLRFLADVADRFADGTARTTHEQNFLLRWVRDEHLSALFATLARAGLARARRGGLDDVVSCPGAESCKLAVTRSRGVASTVREAFAEKPDLLELGRDIPIHVSGCPNGCGLHHVAGIGLQGGMRKVGGRPVPQYFVYAGGGFSPEGDVQFGKVVAKVPARRVPTAIERLIRIWHDERHADESFAAFAARKSAKELRPRLADLEELTEETAREEDFIDLGETQAFEVALGEGECAGP
jgi:sulfite reductase (NADPH) hemoprotein beta-component